MEFKRLFGTDGVRGVVNTELTPEMVLRLAMAIGTYFSSGSRIVVGSDSRAGRSFLTRVVVGGLLSTGVKVFEAGLTPTPALQYYVKTRGFDGGVMITASHNPPEYNGIKVVMPDGVEAPREVEEEIERIFYESRFRRASWQDLSYDAVKVSDVVENYVDAVVRLVDSDSIRKAGLKVVVDPANNVGALTTPKILRRLGVKVLTVNSDISHIPSRNIEPSPENVRGLIDTVKAIGASFGVAHDGDADRAIFIANDGRYIPGDYSAVLLCEHIVKNRGERFPPRVVTAISSSTLVEFMLSEYGIEVVWTKVGAVTIARTMMKVGAIAGFEENGGFMYPKHQYVRDGGMSLALMAELLSLERVPLSELLDRLPKRFVIKRRIYVDRSVLPEVYERIKSTFLGLRFVEVDGIKVISNSFWFLVRPSGTEPLVRVFVEAESEELANQVLKEVLDIFREVIGGEVRTD